MASANSTNGSGTSNSSSRPSTEHPAGFTNYEYILLIIASCIVIINLYVLSLFGRKRSLRRNSNLLLASLSLSDMVTGLLTLPLLVATRPLLQVSFAKYILVFIMADVVTVLSASLIILNLCAITGERYFRICHPLKHIIIVTERRIIMIIVALWILALIYSLFPFAWLHHVLDKNVTRSTMLVVYSSDAKYSTVGAFLFIIPVLVMIVAFSRMFHAIHQLGISERRHTTLTAQQKVQREREHKAILIFGIMFVVFLICWAPWIIIRLIDSEYPKTFGKIPASLLNVLMLIRFLSSIINPLLYTIHKFEFHRALKEDKRRLLALVHCRAYINVRKGSVTTSGTINRRSSSKRVSLNSNENVKAPTLSPADHKKLSNGSDVREYGHSRGSFPQSEASATDDSYSNSATELQWKSCNEDSRFIDDDKCLCGSIRPFDVSPDANVKNMEQISSDGDILLGEGGQQSDEFRSSDRKSERDRMTFGVGEIAKEEPKRVFEYRDQYPNDFIEQNRGLLEQDKMQVGTSKCSCKQQQQRNLSNSVLASERKSRDDDERAREAPNGYCKNPEQFTCETTVSSILKIEDKYALRNDDASKQVPTLVKKVSFKEGYISHGEGEECSSANESNECKSRDCVTLTTRHFTHEVMPNNVTGEPKNLSNGYEGDELRKFDGVDRKSSTSFEGADMEDPRQTPTRKSQIIRRPFLQALFNAEDRHMMKSSS